MKPPIPLKDTILFGKPNFFAFEIKQGINPRKGYLRIWINEILIGTFQKQSEYIHAIADFKKFTKYSNSYYEDIFDQMSPDKIYEYLLAEEMIRSGDPKYFEEATRRHSYTRYYGDQFEGDCNFLSLVKGQTLSLIITHYGKPIQETHRHNLNLNDYLSACTEFTNWFNINLKHFYQ